MTVESELETSEPESQAAVETSGSTTDGQLEPATSADENLDALPPPGQRPLPMQGLPNVVATTTALSHSGPLPPAAEFARYEATLPGAADRILRMAERALEAEIEQTRSQIRAHNEALQWDLQTDRIQANASNAGIRRAQWMAFVLLITVLAVAAFAVYEGQALAGIFLAVAAFGGVIAVLFHGRSSKDKDTDDKTAADRPPDRANDTNA